MIKQPFTNTTLFADSLQATLNGYNSDVITRSQNWWFKSIAHSTSLWSKIEKLGNKTLNARLLPLLSIYQYQKINHGSGLMTSSYSRGQTNKDNPNVISTAFLQWHTICGYYTGYTEFYCSAVMIIPQNHQFTKLVQPPSLWPTTLWN